ncbi:hypothetical protein EON64_02020 [archaeon]|nr:MAG: hypothetical protein EON64_02020 [archaeon]
MLLLREFPDLSKKCVVSLQEPLKSSAYDDSYLGTLRHLVNIVECISDYAQKSATEGRALADRECWKVLEVLKIVTVDLLPAGMHFKSSASISQASKYRLLITISSMFLLLGLSKADLHNILTKASVPIQFEVFRLIEIMLRNVRAIVHASFERSIVNSALHSLFTSYFPDIRDIIAVRST